jgi:hypothetical protein
MIRSEDNARDYFRVNRDTLQRQPNPIIPTDGSSELEFLVKTIPRSSIQDIDTQEGEILNETRGMISMKYQEYWHNSFATLTQSRGLS